MAYEQIDLTTPQPNGKKGEPSTTAWAKVVRMFTELYKGRTTTADRLHYFGANGEDGFTPFTQAARNLLDDADTAAMLATLGLGAPSTVGKNILAAGDAAKVRELLGMVLATSGKWTGVVPIIGADGTMDICTALDFHSNGTETADYFNRMIGNNSGGFYRQANGGNARMLYDQGNVVGSVGQSGGVPTGAIIETGTNSNGRYVRWADGTQICTGLVGNQTGTTTSAGAGYHAYIGTATFAAAFSAEPTLLLGSRANSSYYGVPCSDSTPSTTGTSSVYLWSPTNSYKGQVTYTAIGRWY